MAQPQLESITKAHLPNAESGNGAQRAHLFLAALEGGDRPSSDSVRDILRARARRADFFSARLFADPAWDMLLELYAAELDQTRISVGTLCLGSRVPATTGIRWIYTLEREGLINRDADPLDRRRFFVSLSPAASDAMTAYFSGTSAGPRLRQHRAV